MSSRLAAALVAGACLTLGAAGGSAAVTQITGAGIKDGALTTKDVKDKSLGSSDFAASVSGNRGAKGTDGPAGTPGADVAAAGYSFAYRVPSTTVPAGSTGTTVTITCPAGTTVLGGGGFWATPLNLLDSHKVAGQERWLLSLSQPEGITSVDVSAYAWCAGLDAPAFTIS